MHGTLQGLGGVELYVYVYIGAQLLQYLRERILIENHKYTCYYILEIDLSKAS